MIAKEWLEIIKKYQQECDLYSAKLDAATWKKNAAIMEMYMRNNLHMDLHTVNIDTGEVSVIKPKEIQHSVEETAKE